MNETKIDFKGLLNQAFQQKAKILRELEKISKNDDYVILAKGDIFLPLCENAYGFYYNGCDFTPQYYSKESAERKTAKKIKLLLPTFTELPNGFHKRNTELIVGKPMSAYDYLTRHLQLIENSIKLFSKENKN
jgi:hypothetical protein